MSKLIIIGAGGHGKVVADAAGCDCVFVDQQENAQEGVHAMEELPSLQGSDHQVIVGIGDNGTRLQEMAGLRNIATVIHKDASVSSRASLGEGTVVFAQAAINLGTTIGRGCIINTGATVDHDCNLDDGVHISPGANVGGGVTIGLCSWIGLGAAVKHGVTIGKYVTVGVGAAVVSDIPDNVTVVGVPAKEHGS